MYCDKDKKKNILVKETTVMKMEDKNDSDDRNLYGDSDGGY